MQLSQDEKYFKVDMDGPVVELYLQDALTLASLQQKIRKDYGDCRTRHNV